MPDYAGGTPMRIKRRTVTQLGLTTFKVDLVLTPMIPNPIVQKFTHTTIFGCEHGYWTLPPTNGNLLIGACGIRGGGDQGSGIVPIGNIAIIGTCDPGRDVVGTDWTYIDSNDGGTVVPHTNPITLAYRDAVVSEPQGIRWGADGRARSHQVEVHGISGAPTVTVNDQGYPGPGAVFTSPDITVGSAGYIFAILGYPCTGPSDGSSASFVMTPRGAAQTLTEGFQDDYFGGYTWFGYLPVSGAGTYSITLDRSAKPRSNPDEEGWGWLLAFWPS